MANEVFGDSYTIRYVGLSGLVRLIVDDDDDEPVQCGQNFYDVCRSIFATVVTISRRVARSMF